jgi:hypothetical protein
MVYCPTSIPGTSVMALFAPGASAAKPREATPNMKKITIHTFLVFIVSLHSGSWSWGFDIGVPFEIHG